MRQPYYKDNSCTLLQGHVLDVLKSMEPESVQCVVTSPPYLGLRDYGIEEQDWGDWRGSLGLEPTPELYIQHMVQVFREVRRVLRKDGTCWLNLGDSYATSPPGNKANTTALSSGLPNSIKNQEMRRSAQARKKDYDGLKPKDLCGIPWRVALALQADGWWLRSDIIWHKPNPMPESCTDRPTKAHEYLFLLTKSAKYFYDADAVREPHKDAERERNRPTRRANLKKAVNNGYSTYHIGDNQPSMDKPMQGHPNGRNKRTVWTIATQPYPEAHFATFPTKLVEPCVKAGSAIGDTTLDPFSGSGTVPYVSKELGRHGIGIELNSEYCDLSIKRLRQQVFDW